MITQKDTLKCEAIFNDNHTHRYLWKRVWNKDKPLVAVIMLNPCHSDSIITDTTTSLVINNVARLEKYGGVVIANLFSLMTTKLNFRWNSDDELNDSENDSYIRKAVDDAEIAILAWGRGTVTNQRITERVKQVLRLLNDCKEKLFYITDGARTGLHPLTPSIRAHWVLEPFVFPDNDNSTDDSNDNVPA